MSTIEESKALQKERNAFEKIKAILPTDAEDISTPSGFGNDFPDFGFRVVIGDTVMNLFFEYKSDYTAQMGWIRDWSFDGYKFSSNSALKDDDKMQLLNIMNASSESITNAKSMLRNFKKYYSKKVTSLNSSTLGVLPKQDRYPRIVNLLLNMDNFNISNISDERLGNILLEYFQRKYKNIPKNNREYSVLFIMIDKEIWIVADNNRNYRTLLPHVFKITKKIEELNHLNLQLEIRLQTKPGKNKIIGHPDVYIKGLDPIAAYRMKRKPTGGCKII